VSERILIVDDIPDNLWVLNEILGREGHDVRAVTSGHEALEVAALAPPDLVLLDIRMPEMDGFETCRRLKELAGLGDVPVIFLSASSDINDKLKAFQGGGVDYIEKPFQEAEVLARVRNHLRLRRVQVELAAARDTLEDKVAERTRELAEREAALEYLAYHDSLTDLPNRKKLLAAMNARLADKMPFALLLLDLDRFKEINDALGHPVGDELLIQIAERLQADVPEEAGLVARLGGDEFAIVLNRVTLREAEVHAGRVLTALDQPFSLGGLRVRVGASVGIAMHPQDGATTSELLVCADIAMYAAKRRLGGYSAYSAEIGQVKPTRLELLPEFNEAVDLGQLVLHYQPKQQLADGTVAGLEALVRWNHPQRGLLMPGDFLPLVEMSDLVCKLTEWVIDAAAAQAVAWDAVGIRTPIAVNLSARNLVDESLPDFVRAVVERHGVPRDRLEFEITETAMMVDPDRALHTLERIAELGMGLAIDDFGTGYSSFAFVRRMPPLTAIKIDRSFVVKMPSSRPDAVVVKSMVSLARGLGVAAVAEGVEDEATMDALRRCGCHQVQGYHIARPMDAARAETWLRQQPTAAATPLGRAG